MNNNPIGILDSGVGGVTIAREILRELPHESLIYIGDSRNAPYGDKSAEEIYGLTKRLVGFLLQEKIKLLVVACNTITVSCLDRLREDYLGLPIIGTVPVVKTAAEVTKNKKIGILSTTRTAYSAYQKHLIEEFASDCGVFNHGTDLLVPLIEKGDLTSEEVIKAVEEVLTPMQEEDIDTLALGCTHFPLLRPQMQSFLGSEVRLLDSGGAISRQVKRVLGYNDIVSSQEKPTVQFYTTGNPEIAKKIIATTIEEKKERTMKISSVAL